MKPAKGLEDRPRRLRDDPDDAAREDDDPPDSGPTTVGGSDGDVDFF
jgi:hypothetical protein